MLKISKSYGKWQPLLASMVLQANSSRQWNGLETDEQREQSCQELEGLRRGIQGEINIFQGKTGKAISDSKKASKLEKSFQRIFKE